MLYLDFCKNPGEWTPNVYGGNEDLDAIEFIKTLNSIVKEKFPGAIMIAEEVCDLKMPLSKLTAPVTLYPQYTKNIRVKNKDNAVNDEMVKQQLKTVTDLIAGKGRVLLRKSGTEPVIRIMVECESADKCTEYADSVANVIIERGHSL